MAAAGHAPKPWTGPEGRRILMFYPSRLVPADTGSRRRGRFILDYLLSRFASVHVCLGASAGEPEDREGTAALERLGATVHRVRSSARAPLGGRMKRWSSLLFRGRMPTFESAAWLDPVLEEGFARLVQELAPDAVVVTHTRYAGLVRTFPAHLFSVLDTIDVQWELDRCYAGYTGAKALLRPLLQGWREAGPCYRAEVEVLRKYRRILAISASDREAFLGAGLDPEKVVEMGESGRDGRETPTAAREPKDIDLLMAASRFLGTEESVRFLFQEVLPRCAGPLRVVLAGYVCDYLTETGLAPPPGVQLELAGVVPDLAPFYDRARLVVIPVLRGTGVSIKCAEAFAQGAAVVTTLQGGRGNEAVDGDTCLLASDAEGFARRIDQALADAGLRARLGAAALAASRRSQAAALGALDRMFDAERR